MTLKPPPPEGKALQIRVLQECIFPNRKGYNATVRWRAGTVRQIVHGDYDLYGRAVGWWLDGKVEFLDWQPLKAGSRGSVKVGD